MRALCSLLSCAPHGALLWVCHCRGRTGSFIAARTCDARIRVPAADESRLSLGLGAAATPICTFEAARRSHRYSDYARYWPALSSSTPDAQGAFLTGALAGGALAGDAALVGAERPADGALAAGALAAGRDTSGDLMGAEDPIDGE